MRIPMSIISDKISKLLYYYELWVRAIRQNDLF